jgi:hypothetical protein
MFDGCEATVYTIDGHSCTGKIIDVQWFWCRMMIQGDGNYYSSWLINLDSVNLLCDFSRNAEQSFATDDGLDDNSDGSMVPR